MSSPSPIYLLTASLWHYSLTVIGLFKCGLMPFFCLFPMIILSCPCCSGLRPEFLKDQRFLIIKTASIPEGTLSAASFFAYRPQTAGVTAIMELKPCVLTFSYTFIFKYELPLNILMLPLFISVYWNFKLIPLGMPFL